MRTKLVNGEVIELTAEENEQRDLAEQAWADGAFDRAISQLRSERARRIGETDFYALSDLTLSDEMKNYRQELRDITQDLVTESDVNAVVWPAKPS
jgi:hypothetical protein